MRTKSKILFMALLTLSLSTFAETNSNQGFEKNGMEMSQNQKKMSKEDFYSKLNLNADQKKKMDVILNDFEETMRKNHYPNELILLSYPQNLRVFLLKILQNYLPKKYCRS